MPETPPVRRAPEAVTPVPVAARVIQLPLADGVTAVTVTTPALLEAVTTPLMSALLEAAIAATSKSPVWVSEVAHVTVMVTPVNHSAYGP